MNTIIDFQKIRRGDRLAFDGMAPSTGNGCVAEPKSLEDRIAARLGFTDGAVQFAFTVDQSALTVDKVSCGDEYGAMHTITGSMPDRLSRTRAVGLVSVETRIVAHFGLNGELKGVAVEFVYGTPQRHWVESHEGSLNLAFSV